MATQPGSSGTAGSAGSRGTGGSGRRHALLATLALMPATAAAASGTEASDLQTLAMLLPDMEEQDHSISAEVDKAATAPTAAVQQAAAAAVDATGGEEEVRCRCCPSFPELSLYALLHANSDAAPVLPAALAPPTHQREEPSVLAVHCSP